KKAMELASEMDVFLVPYENERGMAGTADALEKLKNSKKVGVLIGPEGGFDDKEIALAKDAGGEIVSLGKRILRAETAAITALSMCMLYIEMNV
ncbi:MAG: RNA methyltransferase, partial [Clostridia bacterium]|nr:RNA methyltransferase [Clostridia bacterium]